MVCGNDCIPTLFVYQKVASASAASPCASLHISPVCSGKLGGKGQEVTLHEKNVHLMWIYTSVYVWYTDLQKRYSSTKISGDECLILSFE